MKKDYLYIFLHLPKCAGTTLNKHIEKNFSRGEAILLDDGKLGVDAFITPVKGYKKATDKYFSKFTIEEKDKIRFIGGHHVYYGIHKLFTKTPRYFTFVRDPNKRTLSFYNYYRTLYENEKESDRKKRFYMFNLLINHKVPTFYLWASQKYGKKRTYTIPETIYNFMEGLGYLGKGNSDKEKIVNGLKKFYFIGSTESFGEDSLFLYKLFGFNKFFINQNVSKRFYDAITPRDKKLLDSINKLDYVIYRKAEKINIKFKKENPVLFLGLDNLKRKKQLLTPFTQVIFDFTESIHQASSYLRKKSGLYSTFVDNVKGKKL